MALMLVCTTVGRSEDARRIAEAVVGRRLAACVHVDEIASVYRWQGQLQHGAEWRIACKTTDAAAPALQALIIELHPYELPAVWAQPVLAASPAYGAWVAQEVG